ncbi:MAG TPA: hypothetical protein VL485_24295 [Ktedonobacteraceae bacterium]|nr:hypothetical protein [Ktedonobacteraceae bacterium]
MCSPVTNFHNASPIRGGTRFGIDTGRPTAEVGIALYADPRPPRPPQPNAEVV